MAWTSPLQYSGSPGETPADGYVDGTQVGTYYVQQAGSSWYIGFVMPGNSGYLMTAYASHAATLTAIATLVGA